MLRRFLSHFLRKPHRTQNMRLSAILILVAILGAAVTACDGPVEGPSKYLCGTCVARSNTSVSCMWSCSQTHTKQGGFQTKCLCMDASSGGTGLSSLNACAEEYAKSIGLGLGIGLMVAGISIPAIVVFIPSCRVEHKKYLYGSCFLGACLLVSGAAVLAVYLSDPMAFYNGLPS
jgi:hypothetical protein